MQLKSLTFKAPKMLTTKFMPAKFTKFYVQAISYSESKDEEANSVNSCEVAHNKPPHLNLHCLQTELFSFLVF